MKETRLLTKHELKTICRKNKWRNYSRFNKDRLIRYVILRSNMNKRKIKLIQRWWRKINILANDTDVFTLLPFTASNHIFKLREGGVTYQFDCRTLILYMFDSGRFWNPYTRKLLPPFQLQALSKFYFSKYPNDDPIIFNHGLEVLQPSSNLQYVSHVVAREKEQLKAEEESISFLIDEGDGLFSNLKFALFSEYIISSRIIIMTEIIPELTNVFVNLFGINREQSKQYVTNLHIQVAQMLHQNNLEPNQYDILIDVEQWLRSHLHMQERQMFAL